MPRYILDPEWERTRPIGALEEPHMGYIDYTEGSCAKVPVEGLGWWAADASGKPTWRPGPPPWAGRGRGLSPWCPYRHRCPGPGSCPYCRAWQAYKSSTTAGLGEVTSRGRIEELHCLLKHLLNAEGHAEESIANYARRGDKQSILVTARILDNIRRVRQGVFALLYRNGENDLQFDHASAGCARCEADLHQGIGMCPSCMMSMLAM